MEGDTKLGSKKHPSDAADKVQGCEISTKYRK
jgi:hypothetical protein